MTETDPPWRPLLEGAEADRAREVVHDIADELLRRGPELLAVQPPAFRGGLAGGASGIALFFVYLAQATGEGAHVETAIGLLDQAAELLASTVTAPDLYTGFTGVAWCLEHLEGRVFESEGDGNAAIDEALASFLGNPSSALEYDLIRGLAGLGLYALERLPRPRAVGCLERIVDLLAGTAIEGARWFTPAERLPEHHRAGYPEGYFNTGVAHGLPGVLPVLAGAAAAGVVADRARALLDGAVTWLLAQQLDAHTGSCFPYAVAAGKEPQPTRQAWCYGDPGVAAALLATARAVGVPAWEREALRVAVVAANRAPESAGIQDAGLCHGSAGLGHLFNRLYQACGEERLAEAARFWFRQCLEFPSQGHGGLAGFACWGPRGLHGTELAWQDDPGFLTGAAGIGLALLAATTGVTPEWDRLLAISLPRFEPA